MVEQLTLFSKKNDADLEVVEMVFVDKSFTNVEELFSGFNHLYAITFSYGLDFIQKIIQYFDTAQIILGCEAMVKFDLQTIMAFQTRSLQEIKKHKKLLERVTDGTLSFWVAKEILSHQKIFILTSDTGKTRIIWGSANFSGKSFSGNQRENIGYFENSDAAFNYFMDEFETLKEFSTNEVVQDALYVQNVPEEEQLESIPIVKEIKVKDAGIILDNVEDENAADFVYDMNGLSAKYASYVPQSAPGSKKVLVTSNKVHEMIRKYKADCELQKTRQAIYPQFRINYDAGTFSFNNSSYDFNVDPQQVRNDLIHLNEYFEGFDAFIGDAEQTKKAYFRLMNYMFLSPFIARMRYEAYKNDFSTTLFPIYAVLNGPKSAGKSAFIDTVQAIMFGKPLGGVSETFFTKTGILGIMHESTGVPTHIEDINRERFGKYAGEIVKYENDILKKKLLNHPVFVLTANDIETIKPEYAKRVYYCSVDAQLTNVSAASKHKKMAELRKQISTSLYREYLKRMYPKVENLISEMNAFVLTESNQEWKPDIFSLSSQTIIEIFSDLGLDVPLFVSNLKYADYFGYNILWEKARDKIIFEWNHNKKAFRELRKQNLLEYIAGEKQYEAIRMRDAMPEMLRARVSGTKVVMQLDEAEKFFGIHFKKSLF